MSTARWTPEDDAAFALHAALHEVLGAVDAEIRKRRRLPLRMLVLRACRGCEHTAVGHLFLTGHCCVDGCNCSGLT